MEEQGREPVKESIDAGDALDARRAEQIPAETRGRCNQRCQAEQGSEKR